MDYEYAYIFPYYRYRSSRRQANEARQLQELMAEKERHIADREAKIRSQMAALDRDRRVLEGLRQALSASAGEQLPAGGGSRPHGVRHHAHVAAFMQSLEDLLKAAGRPLHVRDIREELLRLGIPIPGRGDHANIIVHLRKCPHV